MTTKLDRLASTGRNPSLSPADVARLLERYFAEDKPSMTKLAEEFPQTNKKGEVRPLSLATVRKYLKSAGLKLPRGRANDLPREPLPIRTLMNRIPTEILIGPGRTELLGRLLERGEGVMALAKAFGISKDRVSRLRKRISVPETEAAEAIETMENEFDEVNTVDMPEDEPQEPAPEV